MADRFSRAQEFRAQLSDQGIWFAPIRHHSPACARAVAQMIAEIDPGAVLIEGPTQYDHLIPALTDPGTTPPIAILSLRSTEEGPISSFFPLAEFSPEWVGLRTAASRGTHVSFIDRPWTSGIKDQALLGLAGERYFAQSQALNLLAEREHCRDHDELWEHLFELRNSDWDTLFDDVFAWCALARLDYEPEVLIAEGSVDREAVMLAHIEAWRGRTSKALVVITGGFHTLALVEALAHRLLGISVEEASETIARSSPHISTDPSWLIRYDLKRLDALTGYGAGIRSPGFYQRQWEISQEQSSDIAVECLTEIARRTNEAQTSDRISVAEVIEASLQAHRLAHLRGHPHPGRADLLDACVSCFERGDLAPAVRDAITEVFTGTRLGVIPSSAPAAPIVAEARETAEKLRLVVTDSSRRTTMLDVRRSPSARKRSRFLWLMSYLGSDFARRVAGPDYIAGQGLSRIREEWEYAWTPMVEANLIALIEDGATLHEAARHRLMSESDSDSSPRSSKVVAELIAQAALIGLGDEMSRLQTRLDSMIEQDSDLHSVLAALKQINGLWRARDLLDICAPEGLLSLVNRALPQLAYLLDEASTTSAEDEPAVISALVATHDLIRNLDEEHTLILREALVRMRTGASSPGVFGAVLALGVTLGEVDDEELSTAVRTAFAPGADLRSALRFFTGVMQAAPDLFLHTPELFTAVDRMVETMEESAFLEVLPELREAFSQLRPFETAQVAEKIARATGGDASQIVAYTEVSSVDLHMGMDIERRLIDSLARDFLREVVS